MCRDCDDDYGPDFEDFEWNTVVGKPIDLADAAILTRTRDEETRFLAHIHKVLVRTQHTLWHEPEVVVDGYPTSLPRGIWSANAIQLRLTKSAAIELSLTLREAVRIAYGTDH